MTTVLKPVDWVSHLKIEDLLRFDSNECFWRKHCEIIVDYMPPNPQPDTRPTVVVKCGDWFMRYSKGPGQGFFWDVYGDHMLNVTMAVLALSQAHRPPDGKPYFEARIPLPRRLSNPDKDGG